MSDRPTGPGNRRGDDPALDEELARAGAMLREGDLRQARDLLRGLLARRPNDAQALGLLGLSCFRLGYLDEAAEIYGRMCGQRPTDPTIRMNLGLVRLKAGAAATAVREFEEALRIDPSHQMSRGYLGIALAELGDLSRSIESLRASGQLELAREVERKLEEQRTNPRVEVRGAAAARPPGDLAAVLGRPRADGRELPLDPAIADSVDWALSALEGMHDDVPRPLGVAGTGPERADVLEVEGGAPGAAMAPATARVGRARAAPEERPGTVGASGGTAATTGLAGTAGAAEGRDAAGVAGEAGEAGAVAGTAVAGSVVPLVCEGATVLMPSGPGPTLERRGSLLLIRIRDSVLSRMDGVIASGGELALEAARRKTHGLPSIEVLGGAGSPIYTVRGHGFLLAAARKRRFTLLSAEGGIYVWERLLYALDGDLQLESGRLLGGDDDRCVVQIRGPGLVALHTASCLFALEVHGEEALRVYPGALAGWTGRVIPRLVSAAGVSGAQPYIECVGDGQVLLEEGDGEVEVARGEAAQAKAREGK